MNSTAITIKKSKNPKKYLVEIDADKLEKLAISLGWFSEDFLKSLDRAEADYKAGRIRKIKSLKDLRHK